MVDRHGPHHAGRTDIDCSIDRFDKGHSRAGKVYPFDPLSIPLSDGLDAFCLGGASFLGFRISLLPLR